MPVNLTEYFLLLSKQLQTSLHAARFFTNTSDIGGVNESALRQVIKPLLPTKYELGIGEIIVPNVNDTERISQSGQKDIIVYDPHTSPIFGWAASGLNLFPIECVYAVLEVKTCINKADDVTKASQQLHEIKKLQKQYNPNSPSPITIAFFFASKIREDQVFERIEALEITERPDMTLCLGSSNSNEQETSFYVNHWHYVNDGHGPIGFVTADEAQKAALNQDNRAIYLTLGETENTLLWFYLFFIRKLQQMDRQIDNVRVPNLFQYALSSNIELGHKRDNSSEVRKKNHNSH